MKQCVILVGGLGSRLGSITDRCPKPLLHINGIPFLEYLIRNAIKHNFFDFLLLAGHLGNKVEEFSDSLKCKLNIRIEVVVEDQPLGTGGAILNAAHKLADKFILINGDTFFDCNLTNIFNIELKSPLLGFVTLRESLDSSRYGVIELRGDRITGFIEKSDSITTNLINGGLYLLDRKITKHIPSGFSSLEQDVFPVLSKIGALSGRCYKNFFIDIGVPDDYKLAQRLIPKLFRI
jgi:NDP-sugar pyrophosphorylase family protein